jgi:hypothetical protein
VRLALGEIMKAVLRHLVFGIAIGAIVVAIMAVSVRESRRSLAEWQTNYGTNEASAQCPFGFSKEGVYCVHHAMAPTPARRVMQCPEAPGTLCQERQ